MNAMKANYVLAAFSVAAFSGFSTLVATAETQKDTAAESAATDETMKVFIVTAKGGGWGAGRAVRAAISNQKGVESFKMSGLRTTVFMKDGESLEEAKLKEAFAKGPVSFVSLEDKEQAVPVAAYLLQVSGAGWAVTNDKARAALEELPGVAAAYVNRSLEIQLTEDKPLDEEAVKQALGKHRIKVKSVKKIML
mgnify:CR=1 FL=1